MPLTLPQALGRPIEDLEDATLAHLAFPFAKHGWEENQFSSAEEAARDQLNNMSNEDFLLSMSLGLSTLLDALKARGDLS